MEKSCKKGTNSMIFYDSLHSDMGMDETFSDICSFDILLKDDHFQTFCSKYLDEHGYHEEDSGPNFENLITDMSIASDCQFGMSEKPPMPGSNFSRNMTEQSQNYNVCGRKNEVIDIALPILQGCLYDTDILSFCEDSFCDTLDLIEPSFDVLDSNTIDKYTDIFYQSDVSIVKEDGLLSLPSVLNNDSEFQDLEEEQISFMTTENTSFSNVFDMSDYLWENSFNEDGFDEDSSVVEKSICQNTINSDLASTDTYDDCHDYVFTPSDNPYSLDISDENMNIINPSFSVVKNNDSENLITGLKHKQTTDYSIPLSVNELRTEGVVKDAISPNEKSANVQDCNENVATKQAIVLQTFQPIPQSSVGHLMLNCIENSPVYNACNIIIDLLSVSVVSSEPTYETVIQPNEKSHQNTAFSFPLPESQVFTIVDIRKDALTSQHNQESALNINIQNSSEICANDNNALSVCSGLSEINDNSRSYFGVETQAVDDTNKSNTFTSSVHNEMSEESTFSDLDEAPSNDNACNNNVVSIPCDISVNDSNSNSSLQDEESDRCTCPRINVGMDNKFVSLRKRDILYQNLRDMIGCFKKEQPKTEKELGKEWKKNYNLLRDRKLKRLNFEKRFEKRCAS